MTNFHIDRFAYSKMKKIFIRAIELQDSQNYVPRYFSTWNEIIYASVIKPSLAWSDNGLVPGRHQAIIWTNAGILLIGTLGTNFSEILSEINKFSLKKMHLKMSSGKWRPFCPGLNVLNRFVNSSPPGQNGRHFGRWHFQLSFFNENDKIPIPISLKYVSRSPIDNKSALVQVMAWRRTGDKPLPKPLMTQFIDA